MLALDEAEDVFWLDSGYMHPRCLMQATSHVDAGGGQRSRTEAQAVFGEGPLGSCCLQLKRQN